MTAATQKTSAIETYIDQVNPQWVRLLDMPQMQTRYTLCPGAELHTAQGDILLDFLSGYCVHNIGHIYPGTEDVMGWDISERGFQIVLSPSVQEVIREHPGRDLNAFLRDDYLSRQDIGSWIMHTGGPKVPEDTQDALGVGREALQLSWDCWRKTGNLSSASALCVLEEVMTSVPSRGLQRTRRCRTWLLLRTGSLEMAIKRCLTQMFS